MKTKKVALINGIVGLVGGIFLLIAVLIITASALNDVATTLDTAYNGGSAISITSTTLASTLALFVKIVILVLGIVGSVYYKDDDRIGSAPNVLLIVGGALAIIPFLGWVGGILAIIGGSLYLASLKKFQE